MPHGAPDDSNILSIGPVYTGADLGELAVRLGAPLAFLRSGNVLSFDTFAAGLSGWTTYDYGATPVRRLSNEYAQYDGVTLKLATSAEEGSYAGAYRVVCVPQLRNVGLSLALLSDAVTDRVTVTLAVYYDSVSYEFGVSYYHQTGDVYCLTTDLASVLVANIPNLITEAPRLSWLKLVGNVAENRYDALYYGNNRLDLSQVPPYSAVTAVPDSVDLRVETYTSGIGVSRVWVDAVIFTVNEI